MQFREFLLLNEKIALAGNYKGTIFQRLVAAQYMLMPVFDPAAKPAFEELARKMGRQEEFLKSKFSFKPTSNDPYQSTKQMTQDINMQKQAGVKKPEFRVFAEPPGTEGQGHPVFSNNQNVMVRGVHDAIAHYAGQHPFSARGEYAAYNRHLKTLCNRDQLHAGACEAAKALFTEVVAQTSCFYIYGRFVDQKVGFLNDFNCERIGELNANSPLNAYFEIIQKQLLCKSNFEWNKFSDQFPELATEIQKQDQLGANKAPLAPFKAAISQFH